MSLLNHYASLIGRQPPQVSILVILDVALKPHPGYVCPWRDGVSILVILDVALKPQTTTPVLDIRPVSILVILDVALKLSYIFVPLILFA